MTRRISYGSVTRRQGSAALLFVTPSLVILSIFVFWPIVDTFWLSFHHWFLLDPAHPFVGFANYAKLLHDPEFQKSVVNTVYYTVGTVVPSIAISLGLAILCTQKLKGIRFFQSLYFLPVISSFAIIAIIWSFLMDPDIGLLSYYLKIIHFPTNDLLRDPTYAMLGVIIVAIWKNVGFNMVIFIAGLQSIPSSLYEAAKMDGASGWERFRSVTLPMLRHTLLFVVIISVIASFQVFDQVYVMTRGGPLFSTETIVYYIYHQGFEVLNMGYASSAAWLLFIVIFVLTIFQLKLFRYDKVD